VSITQDLTIRVTPARHFSGRTFVRDKTLWVGYLLETPQRKLFFSGDSGYGPHFAEIGRKYGPIAWAALDMGQYDPRWANVHMSPEQAAHAAADIHTKALTPSHVGRFSIAPHDWDDPFKRIFKASRSRSSALWTPIIGHPVYFDGRKQDFYAWWSTVK
jgi:L-ascorbate metabolism protein UlaG (beta-lactamase superfamily)